MKVSTILGSMSTNLGKCQPNTGKYLKKDNQFQERQLSHIHTFTHSHKNVCWYFGHYI